MIKKMMAILCFIIISNHLNANMFNYVVSGFEETKNAKAGKEILIKKSRLLALKITMNKFISIEDSEKLDKLLDLDNALLFEEGFKVKNESITNVQYSATIEFAFNKKRIWAFFNANSINFLENKLSDIVVILDTSMLESQQETNKAVQSFSTINTYLSHSFYYDSAIFDSENTQAVETIRKKYKARAVHKIKIIKHEDKYEVYVVNLLNKNELNAQEINNIDIAIDKAHMFVEEEEKAEKIKTFSTNFTSNVLSFNHSNFTQWQQIQKKLSLITGLVVNYIEISDNNIYFTISYKGNFENLLDILDNQCISINQKNNSLFVMNKCKYKN